MPHYKDADNRIYFLDSEQFAPLLPEGCVPITDEQAQALRAPTVADLAVQVRAQRAPLLDVADKGINRLEDNGQDAGAWRKYRQALRDVPAQKGFPGSVKWPAPPA